MGRVHQFLRGVPGTYPASRARPSPLPPIEPELRVRTPRPWVWVDSEDMRRWEREVLIHWRAARAWVYEHSAWSEPDGPEVRARYAFETEEGTLAFGRYSGSFDGFHLAMNVDFCHFIDHSVCQGGTFTVLHRPGKPWDHYIYGVLQARIYVPVAELARQLLALGPTDTREREELRAQLLAAFKSVQQAEYYSVMQGLIGRKVRLESYYDYALKALEAVERGEASAAALEAAQRRQQGRWAAM